jgi:hypothetical protein
MAAKRVLREKEVKSQEESEFYEEPKRLSKLGEWRRANPKGLEGTFDMRAVMR